MERLVFKKKQFALVQLSSGETIAARAVDPKERSDEVIKKFVSDTFITTFNWDGLVKTFNEKGEPITKQDTGVEIGRLNNKSNIAVCSSVRYKKNAGMI
ncbi:hypothetical protein LC613_33025 [Nostoc sphaeroides CHAB 2801]|uniref:hypothetical protein n=1 Tax=Nostoc sphaeroides TaxID=446679 RepID=UPI001E3A3B40|nr:hypothetical protein [Nostoc sphaeroides]MCC5632447.1 hypothetical protein [Nostoc sphaeroides CHAB 2801]